MIAAITTLWFFLLNLSWKSPDRWRLSPAGTISPKDPRKRETLNDVLFSGGLCRNEDGTATLYVGVSDAEAHYITIPDPFRKYERIAPWGK